MDDAEAIRAGIESRRERRRQRKRHRLFIAVALVAAAAITVTAYATSSSGPRHTPASPSVSTGPVPTSLPPTTAAAADTEFAPSPGAVQWVDTPPQPAPPGPGRPAVPPGTNPCTAFQLDAKGSWQLNGNAVIGGIRFSNHSATPCSLHGVPDIRVTDNRGIRVDLPQQPSATPDGGPVLLNPGDVDAASTGLQWTNSCSSVQAPVSLRVNLPDGGNVIDVAPDAPNSFAALPPCGNPQAPTAFAVDPVQAAAAPQAPPPSAALTAAIRSPASVAAGGRLRYEVTLTNPTQAAIALDPCPSYSQSLAGVTASYQLNCGPVGQIGPGASAVFSMELALPADVQRGTATLQWQAGGPTASVPIQITG